MRRRDFIVFARNRVLAALCLGLLFFNGTAPRAAPGATRTSPRGTPRALRPEELYTQRALRRARLIIEMRLLQFRIERLECVRLAILRNLPPDLRPAERGAEGHRALDPETCAKLLQ
jgi:hypothetical protein